MGDQINDEIFRDLPFPLPIVTEEGPLLDPELSNVPGKIVVDKSGQLLLRYLTYSGVAGDIIAIYNNFILRRIPHILSLKYLPLENGHRIVFLNPKVLLPRESKLATDSKILYPYQARIRKDTYSFCLTADIAEVDENNQIVKSGGINHIFSVSLAENILSIDDNQYAISMDGTLYEISIDNLPHRIAVNNQNGSITIDDKQYGINMDGTRYNIMIGGQAQIREGKLIGCIPAMIGSAADNLVSPRRLTKEELLQVGECMYDPGGYFIIKGEERLIITQERLRVNRILIYNDREGDIEARVTSNSIKGSTTIRMYKDNDQSIRLYFSLLTTKAQKSVKAKEAEEEAQAIMGKALTSTTSKKNKGYETVCVLQIFRILSELVVNEKNETILGFNDITNIILYILQFVQDDWKKKVLIELQGSFIATINIGDDYRDIYDKSFIKRKWEKEKSGQFKKKKGPVSISQDPLSPNVWVNQTIPEIRRGVIEKIFSHITMEGLNYGELSSNFSPEYRQNISAIAWKKINYLAIMTARLAETTAGLRPIDDRDHWANKRLESPGNLLEQLFRQLWDDSIKALIEKLSTKKVTVDTVYDLYQSNLITGTIEASFIPNNWGANTGVTYREKQQNVTDRLDRGQSIVAVFSHITQVNKPTNRRVKQASIRGVQLSQAGYIDVVDSPSGGAVGLVLRKAITCWISVARDYQEVWKIAEQAAYDNADDEHNDMLIINGVPSSWCNGPQLRSILVEARRSLQIPFDVALVYKKPILSVSTDSSRPTRPLLVVKDLVPVIVSKNLWKQPIDVLLREGAVEYMDPWELHVHGVVAQSFHDLTFMRQDLARNRGMLAQLEGQLPQAEVNLKLYPRPANLTDEEANRMINEINAGQIKQQLDGDDNPDPVANWLWAKSEHNRITEQIDRIRINIRRIEVKRYTHVEMDPTAILGIASSVEPFIGNTPGPRNSFQCNMLRQAIGINHSNPSTRFPAKDLVLTYPSRAIVGTQMERLLGLDDLPAGQNVIMAIMTMKDNEEDGITVKEEALQNGLFTHKALHSSEVILEKRPVKTSKDETSSPDKPGVTIVTITERETSDHLVKPKKPFPGHVMSNYDSIDEEGLAIPDYVVSAGDCLVGIIRRVSTTITKEERRVDGKRVTILSRNKRTDLSYVDKSVYVNPWEGGIIDKVLVSRTADGNIVIRVRVRTIGQPIVGDKAATRHAQKSVISRIVPARDLPFTADGIVPDVFLNPHSLPKRMTIGTLIEIVTGKYGALADERINGTAFRPFELDTFTELLQTFYGYNKFGVEKMINPLTGEAYPALIMIGPSYYQLLKHRVKKKTQVRAKGAITALTRQPVKGRKHGGGMRLGEQERDALIGHGASEFLHERLGTASDLVSSAFCTNCNKVTVNKIIEDRHRCAHCSSNETRQCQIPYSFISLINYASIAGIKVGLLTDEENVDRLPSGLAGLISDTPFQEEVAEEEMAGEFDLVSDDEFDFDLY